MSSNRERYDEDLTNQEIDEMCNKIANFDKTLKACEDQKEEIKRLREQSQRQRDAMVAVIAAWCGTGDPNGPIDVHCMAGAVAWCKAALGNEAESEGE